MKRAMQRLFFLLAASGLLLGYTACERHSWETTRVLHLKHEDHGQHAQDEGASPDKGEAAQ